MANLIDEMVEKLSAFKGPIPGPSPAGTDITFDPEFEAVKAEFDKLSALDGATPNWAAAVEGASQLLVTKTKDLRLLLWLSFARLRRNGLLGLAEGLVITREVCREYWDGMFPPLRRAKARGNLAGWFNEQIAAHLQSQTSVPDGEAEAMRAVAALLTELDGLFAEKLGDAYSGPGPLRGVLRDKLRSLPAEQTVAPPAVKDASASTSGNVSPSGAVQDAKSPAPQPPASASSPVEAKAEVIAAAAPAVSVPTPPASLGSETEVVSALREVGKTIVEAAQVLRKADPGQPWPYRLHRLGIWLTLKQAPVVEGGRTRIKPPLNEHRKKVEGMVNGEQWAALLNTCEELSARYIFWLDLHRLAVMAMDRLGALFLQARSSLVREVLTFHQINPTVFNLTFDDGTPFADNATKGWVQEEAGKVSGGGGAASTQVSEEEAELAKRFEEAKELVSTGKVPEGLSLAMQLAARGGDPRTRFRSRLTVARLALQGGKPEVARPLFERLGQEAELHHLEEWEPSLVAPVYAGLYECLAVQKDVAAPAEQAVRRRDIFDKLCRIDPALGLRAAGQ